MTFDNLDPDFRASFRASYETLLALTSRRKGGYRVQDLIAMKSQNDPFYSGAPATMKMAEWFTRMWQRFGYTSAAHLRRCHYRILSLAVEVQVRHDGSPYLNNLT